MHKSLFRRTLNRILHIIAQFAPGCSNFRPYLHRLRGVKIGNNVLITDQIYIENEYPECVEIGEGVEIAPKVNIIAHRLGPGKVIIQKNAFIGMGCNIAAEAGKTLTIGEGSVIAMGSVVNSDVPPYTFVAGNPAKPKRKVTIPLTRKTTIEEFKKGLVKLD
jgi:acetyltransferase-like isoleucine patch superfamily enzyme